MPEKETEKNELVVKDSNELLPQEGLVDQVQEILADLEVVKREALEGFYLFKDLLANEGEGSAATKEQMASMLQLYLSTVDTRLKTVDTLIRAKKQSQGGGSSKTNINIMGASNTGGSVLSRREMLEEIEKLVDVGPDQVEVIQDQEQDS